MSMILTKLQNSTRIIGIANLKFASSGIIIHKIALQDEGFHPNLFIGGDNGIETD